MKHNHNASIGCKVGNAPITAMSQINGQRLLAVSYLCMISERFGNEKTTTRLLSKTAHFYQSRIENLSGAYIWL